MLPSIASLIEQGDDTGEHIGLCRPCISADHSSRYQLGLLTPTTALAVLEEEDEDAEEDDAEPSGSRTPLHPTSRIFAIPQNLRALVTNVPGRTQIKKSGM